MICDTYCPDQRPKRPLSSDCASTCPLIAFSKSFHGRTSLAVSVTDNKSYIAPVNENDNVIFLPFNDEETLEACFRNNGKEISSVIIEGIQGVGGINVAADSFFEKNSNPLR